MAFVLLVREVPRFRSDPIRARVVVARFVPVVPDELLAVVVVRRARGLVVFVAREVVVRGDVDRELLVDDRVVVRFGVVVRFVAAARFAEVLRFADGALARRVPVLVFVPVFLVDAAPVFVPRVVAAFELDLALDFAAVDRAPAVFAAAVFAVVAFAVVDFALVLVRGEAVRADALVPVLARRAPVLALAVLRPVVLRPVVLRLLVLRFAAVDGFVERAVVDRPAVERPVVERDDAEDFDLDRAVVVRPDVELFAFTSFSSPDSCPFRRARAALVRVFSDVRPFFGSGKSTPARRALESPMATACFFDVAPCLPRPMCSISSRTKGPACVLGAFPSLFSRRALFSVVFSGIPVLLLCVGNPCRLA